MNDEINSQVTDRIVSFSFQAGRFTAGTLKAAMQKYMNHLHEKQRDSARHKDDVHVSGKMKLEELVAKGEGATPLEVRGDRLKEFEKVIKKYRVDYAVNKDSSTEPPKFTVFFKGKDAGVIENVFKEFVEKNEKKQEKTESKERPSVREKLEEKKKKAASKEQAKEKNKNRKRVKEKKRIKEKERSL